MRFPVGLQPVALTMCLALVSVTTTSVQRLTFEAASVKRSVPGTTGGRVQFLPGRFAGENVTLDYLLQQLYGVRDFQIIAAPEWKRSSPTAASRDIRCRAKRMTRRRPSR